MVIHGVNNITRKPMFISYRKEYHADALIGFRESDPDLVKIEFSVEMTPLGDKLVRIQFLDDIHYPLVPVLRELKDHISSLELNGALP